MIAPTCDEARAVLEADAVGAGVSYNATIDILERNAANERRARPYLIEEDRVYLYGEVIERARAFGAGLLRCGLVPGDRLLILCADGAPFVSSFWGAIRVGVVAVPIAVMLSSDELDFVLRDSGARAIVYDRSAEGLVGASKLGTVVPVAVDVTNVPNALPWELVKDTTQLPVRTTAAHTAFWLYTSGTTDTPKAVLHSHANLRAAGEGQARQVLKLCAGDRILSVSRMFFAYGLGNSVYLPAGVGASVVINRRQAVPRII